MKKADIRNREEAIAQLYTHAAKFLENAREVVALHDWCVNKFGDAPPFPNETETRRIAAMRDVEELLADPVQGLRGSLGALTH